VFQSSQIRMGALPDWPVRIMIIGAVHKYSIVHPISDGHRSHDEVAVIHPENADVSAHDGLSCGMANNPHRSRTICVRRRPRDTAPVDNGRAGYLCFGFFGCFPGPWPAQGGGPCFFSCPGGIL
jgi:hypothetical protein